MKNAVQTLKEYFIPREDNDHKPHVLRGRTVAFVLMVALVAEAAFVFGTTYVAPNSRLFGIITTNALIDETNQSRTTNSVPALQESSVLDAAAQEKANDMATKGYFAHTSPTGVTPWYWFANVGYSFTYAGENLAVNFTDSQDVTTAWMNSPEHRENILDNNFTQIGMATAQGIYEGRSAIFVVELFGAPAASPYAFLNTAAAAIVPAAVPATTTTQTSAPAAKPAPKPVAIAKTAPAVPVIPGVQTVVPVTPTTTSNTATDTEPSFVAVKGVATQNVSLAGATPAQAPAQPVAQPVVTPTQAAPASTLLQRAFSDPKKLANDFYYLLMLLFFLAVALNIFIKIRIQHPKLIFSGLLVMIVAGLCILLNQNISLLHAAVL